MTNQDNALLEAALIGYQHQADQLAEKIADIRRQLGGKTPSAAPKAAAAVPVKKRSMSAAARKRIAAAQKKRWAEYHRQKEPKGLVPLGNTLESRSVFQMASSVRVSQQYSFCKRSGQSPSRAEPKCRVPSSIFAP
ncbi:MAG: hypothetical protein WDO73_22360 [Ignavibacteriota bacterium]